MDYYYFTNPAQTAFYRMSKGEKNEEIWDWSKNSWEPYGFFIKLNDLDETTEEFVNEKINERIKEEDGK